MQVNWEHSWSSSFYLVPEKTMVKIEEEFRIFDLSDTINGIGGALGLFLGWSVLHLANQATVLVTFVISRFSCNRAKL